MDSQSDVAGSVASGKPKPLDFSHLYSEVTKHRQPSKMKEYYKFFEIPGIGNLAGGLPNVQFFPFDTLEAQTAKPERWTPSPNHPDEELVQPMSTAKISSSSSSSDDFVASHITVPKQLSEKNALKKIDLASALQYGLAQGYPPLYSWIRQFTTQHLHPNIPYEGGADICLTVGSTDGFAKTLDLFVNPWSPEKDDIRDRPGLLSETFMYGNILSQSMPKGVQVVPVKADEGGMVVEGPDGLEDVLANWDEETGKRPHLLYTVSMGHNPTGIVLSVERRKAIYEVCSKYDVIIVEDDPYWYLQFPSAEIEEANSRNRFVAEEGPKYTPENSSGYDFLDSLVPSFLNFDTDGRVVRLDTFSKTVAPGCRLGWITAQPDLIERYVRIGETSTQQPSGFVQSVIAELVMGTQPPATEAAFRALRSNKEKSSFSAWKMDGWVRWLEGLRGEYERRMNKMCRILDEGCFQVKQGTPRSAADADWGVITKTQLYEFSWPRGGMFIWLRMFFEDHPLWGAIGSDGTPVDGTALSTGLMIFLTTKPYLVLVSPGMMFSATDEIRRDLGWAYYRLCFAAETDENIDRCSKGFTEGVQKFWRLKKVEELEELIKKSPVAAIEEAGSDLGNFGTWLGC